MARRILPALTMLAALALSIPLSAQTVTTFDAPGAGTGAFQGTYAFNIAPSGTIIGFSRDVDNVRHGFVRSKNGTFTIFDAPGAGSAAGQGTRAYAINPSETLTGFFFDSTTSGHAYLRSKEGVITGCFFDASDVSHGFVRERNGVITTFDVPGAGTGPGQGPYVFSIAPNGATAGYSLDPDNVVHGFVLTK